MRSDRYRLLLFGAILAMGTSAGLAQSIPVRTAAVLSAKVVGVEIEPRRIALDLGAESGLRVGDPFWLIATDHVIVPGEITSVLPQGCMGRLHSAAPVGTRDVIAVVVRTEGLHEARLKLPLGATLAGTCVRLPPGRRTGWIDLGRRAGLLVDDGLLIRRKGIPIARARVSLLEEETALVALQPVVANALTQAGDRVELWPAPGWRPLGRLNTSILAVAPDPEGPLLTLVGTAADGLQPGEVLDIFRGDQFVGVAVLLETDDPFSVAQLVESASALPVAVGDIAVARPLGSAGLFPLRAVIFKVDSADYCLFAAGESDGVRENDLFVVRRADPEEPTRLIDVAELRVTTVKPQHAGAAVRILSAGAELRPWDWAERRVPAWPHALPVGVVTLAEPSLRWGLADIEVNLPTAPGDVVGWRSEAAGPSAEPAPAEGASNTRPADSTHSTVAAALVVWRFRDRALLYVPPGWGDPAHLLHAQLTSGQSVLQP